MSTIKDSRGRSRMPKYNHYGLDIRKPPHKIIDNRLEEMGRTRYWLAHQAGCIASPPTVFRFLNGETGHQIRSDFLLDMFTKVGITLAMAPGAPGGAEERED